jgi:hypothetical protein
VTQNVHYYEVFASNQTMIRHDPLKICESALHRNYVKHRMSPGECLMCTTFRELARHSSLNSYHCTRKHSVVLCFEVFTEVSMKKSIFRDIISCSPVRVN